MVKNRKGFRWVQLTDEQYQKCVEMSEPDTNSSKNQFETVSFVVGWCVDSMYSIPASLPTQLKKDPLLYGRICDLLMKGEI